MQNKGEEDVSWLLLWGATIIYIAALCMTFSGLVALGEHGRSAVSIFNEFVKDYSSLLAGIPVLVAVLVAKQQLDANRRQHVAQIKRSFKKELDALNEVTRFNNLIQRSSQEHFFDAIVKYDLSDNNLFSMPEHRYKEIRPLISNNAAVCVYRINKHILSFDPRMSEQQKNDIFNQITTLCSVLSSLINAGHADLEQYWS